MQLWCLNIFAMFVAAASLSIEHHSISVVFGWCAPCALSRRWRRKWSSTKSMSGKLIGDNFQVRIHAIAFLWLHFFCSLPLFLSSPLPFNFLHQTSLSDFSANGNAQCKVQNNTNSTFVREMFSFVRGSGREGKKKRREEELDGI